MDEQQLSQSDSRTLKRRQSSSSQYIIPHQSGSSQIPEHDYTGMLAVSTSTEQGMELQKPRVEASLMDDDSVSSIYTTESEKPYDEKTLDRTLLKVKSYHDKSGEHNERSRKQWKVWQKRERSPSPGKSGKGETGEKSSIFRRMDQEKKKEQVSTRDRFFWRRKPDEAEMSKRSSSPVRIDIRDPPYKMVVFHKGDQESDSSCEEQESNKVITKPSKAVKTFKSQGKVLKEKRGPIFPLWTWLTEEIFHNGIKKTIAGLGTSAARNPYTYLMVMTALAVAVLATGFFTNFTLIVDSDKIYTPMNSFAVQHHQWLVEESGFNTIRPIVMIIHMHGENVLGKEPLERVFQAVDVVRETPGYDELCEQGTFYTYDDIHTCRIISATRFWDHNTTLFHEEVTTDDVVTQIMSQPTFRDGNTPVFHEVMLGNYRMGNTTLEYRASTDSFEYHNHPDHPTLHFVQSYVVRIEIPDIGDDSDVFEAQALERLKDLKRDWQVDNTTQMELDFLSIFAYKIENQRALIRDLPLVGGIVVVLIVFTSLVYMKRHPVYSRSMLGVASLLSIGMSLAMSYGIVWCIGIPFTNIAQILPFMVMGVGLDDTFIITGEYFRTNPNHSIEKRVVTTMHEAALSITVTTATTMVAFVLGSFSAIPGVQWLCWYAFAAMGSTYIFQLTYFVALLTLDERRLQAYRQNICCWRKVPVDLDDCESQIGVVINSSADTNSTQNDNDGKNTQTKTNDSAHFSEQLMVWYATQLMRPLVKCLVLLAFMGYTSFCGYRMTLLTQEFNVEDYTPADSYLRGSLHSLASYYSLTKPVEVYFRDVDQSDPEVQQQMRDYVDELAALPQIGEDAPFCWVRDFPTIEERYPQYASFLHLNLTFSHKLQAALANPTIREIFGEDIVMDEETGEIVASRCLLFLRNLDLTVVNDQIDFLKSQRRVTDRQAINQGQDEMKFFSFDNIFFYWELYAQAVAELIVTIVTGVVAVTVVTFVLIPHWSAIFFVCPGIMILYVNFLGTMQWMGMHINSLTYVIIVMAIGLLVDFLVHIMLRYYEVNMPSREEKVKETLRTMGASVFVGGTSTFLAVIPLLFSSTHIFRTVFWCFLSIVTLGLIHGLILLPVVLSLLGPICTHHAKSAAMKKTSSASSTVDTDELVGQHKVTFLGPANDLEVIAEAPESSKSGKSRRSILEAPSDEISQTSPRSLAVSSNKPMASLLDQLTRVYGCMSDHGENDTGNLKVDTITTDPNPPSLVLSTINKPVDSLVDKLADFYSCATQMSDTVDTLTKCGDNHASEVRPEKGRYRPRSPTSPRNGAPQDKPVSRSKFPTPPRSPRDDEGRPKFLIPRSPHDDEQSEKSGRRLGPKSPLPSPNEKSGRRPKSFSPRNARDDELSDRTGRSRQRSLPPRSPRDDERSEKSGHRQKSPTSPRSPRDDEQSDRSRRSHKSPTPIRSPHNDEQSDKSGRRQKSPASPRSPRRDDEQSEKSGRRAKTPTPKSPRDDDRSDRSRRNHKSPTTTRSPRDDEASEKSGSRRKSHTPPPRSPHHHGTRKEKPEGRQKSPSSKRRRGE